MNVRLLCKFKPNCKWMSLQGSYHMRNHRKSWYIRLCRFITKLIETHPFLSYRTKLNSLTGKFAQNGRYIEINKPLGDDYIQSNRIIYWRLLYIKENFILILKRFYFCINTKQIKVLNRQATVEVRFYFIFNFRWIKQNSEKKKSIDFKIFSIISIDL